MDDELSVAQVHLQRGQIYRSCASASGPPRYVRILDRDRGTDRYRVADAVTGGVLAISTAVACTRTRTAAAVHCGGPAMCSLTRMSS
ncbi:hypothetical protein [Streptomyces sp. B21-083]|uniref:hypothetical protein n=1 Tax=Streptomyces sp. B21-083 TaxID=3039410 RepID=UPI002FF0F8E4